MTNDSKTGYRKAIRQIEEAEAKGEGFLLCVDHDTAHTAHMHGVSSHDMANFIAAIFRDNPEVKLLAEAFEMMRKAREKAA